MNELEKETAVSGARTWRSHGDYLVLELLFSLQTLPSRIPALSSRALGKGGFCACPVSRAASGSASRPLLALGRAFTVPGSVPCVRVPA